MTNNIAPSTTKKRKQPHTPVMEDSGQKSHTEETTVERAEMMAANSRLARVLKDVPINEANSWRVQTALVLGTALHWMAVSNLVNLSGSVKTDVLCLHTLFLQIVVAPEIRILRVGKYALNTTEGVITFLRDQLCIPLLACTPVNFSMTNGRAFHLTVPPKIDFDTTFIRKGICRIADGIGLLFRVPGDSLPSQMALTVKRVPYGVANRRVKAALEKACPAVEVLRVEREFLDQTALDRMTVMVALKDGANENEALLDKPDFNLKIKVHNGPNLFVTDKLACGSCGEEDHLMRVCPWVGQMTAPGCQTFTTLGQEDGPSRKKKAKDSVAKPQSTRPPKLKTPASKSVLPLKTPRPAEQKTARTYAKVKGTKRRKVAEEEAQRNDDGVEMEVVEDPFGSQDEDEL
jgi:hypothetical protein